MRDLLRAAGRLGSGVCCFSEHRTGCYTDVGDTMVTEISLQALPDPESIFDEATASDALHRTLAAVATANRKLANAPKEAQVGGHRRDWEAFHEEIMSLFRDLHELLPKIASFRVDITSWSVTVGMSNTLTVNFANKYAQDSPSD
jgi:hypothetical protein